MNIIPLLFNIDKIVLHNDAVRCSYSFLSNADNISLNLLQNRTKPGYELVQLSSTLSNNLHKHQYESASIYLINL